MLRGLLVSRLLVSLAADDGLDALARGVHNSWVLELSPDPEQAAHWPNRAAREVRSGHWVGVRPAALPDPALVSLSAEPAALLGLPGERALRASSRFASCSGRAAGAGLERSAAPRGRRHALDHGQETVPDGGRRGRRLRRRPRRLDRGGRRRAREGPARMQLRRSLPARASSCLTAAAGSSSSRARAPPAAAATAAPYSARARAALGSELLSTAASRRARPPRG